MSMHVLFFTLAEFFQDVVDTSLRLGLDIRKFVTDHGNVRRDRVVGVLPGSTCSDGEHDEPEVCTDMGYARFQE